MSDVPTQQIDELNISHRYENYTLAGRLWVNGHNKKFLGFGRILFLQKIKEFGSISEAAKQLKMSYKHAWDMVDALNNEAGIPLVQKTRGGRGGGGACLSQEGEKIANLFVALYKNFKTFLSDQEDILKEINRIV